MYTQSTPGRDGRNLKNRFSPFLSHGHSIARAQSRFTKSSDTNRNLSIFEKEQNSFSNLRTLSHERSHTVSKTIIEHLVLTPRHQDDYRVRGHLQAHELSTNTKIRSDRKRIMHKRQTNFNFGHRAYSPSDFSFNYAPPLLLSTPRIRVEAFLSVHHVCAHTT